MISDQSTEKEKQKTKEEPSSYFQRQRVDILLSELSRKFPPKLPAQPQEKPGTVIIVHVLIYEKA